MYSPKDFKMLELKKRGDLRTEIARAKELHSRCQQHFEGDGEDYKIELLIDSLKRIEAYIRKAENILNQYDDNRNIRNILKIRKKNNLDMDLVEENNMVEINLIEGEI